MNLFRDRTRRIIELENALRSIIEQSVQSSEAISKNRSRLFASDDFTTVWREAGEALEGTLPMTDDYTRTYAIMRVKDERDRQNLIWGQQDHAQQAWVGILGEEFGEYCQAVNETYLNNAIEQHKGGYENLLTELTHVAAVAVGAMESLMRNRNEEV